MSFTAHSSIRRSERSVRSSCVRRGMGAEPNQLFSPDKYLQCWNPADRRVRLSKLTVLATNKMTIHYETSGRVALITIRRPPVNSLNHSTRQALLTALNRALDDPD